MDAAVSNQEVIRLNCNTDAVFDREVGEWIQLEEHVPHVTQEYLIVLVASPDLSQENPEELEPVEVHWTM